MTDDPKIKKHPPGHEAFTNRRGADKPIDPRRNAWTGQIVPVHIEDYDGTFEDPEFKYNE